MKFYTIALFRPRWALSALLLMSVLTAYRHAHSNPEKTIQIPASLIGVHHLGPDYYIYKFWVNKSIGDNIGEGGGGSSMVCCIMLPSKWNPSLKADIRWEVDHITRTHDSKVPETAELTGIYRAEVPIEKYTEPGDLFVHFFSNGRVRVVVSSTTFDSKTHPIRSGDTRTSLKATAGKSARTLFTDDEVAELKRIADDTRKENGGWR